MATYYWVGGAGTWDTTTTTRWATSSGGAGGAGVPTAADNVIINTSSGTGQIICTGSVCLDLTVTATQGISLGDGSGGLSTTLSVYGSLSFPSGGSFSVAANAGTSFNIIFAATTTGKTVSFNSKNLVPITFNGVGGGWTLTSTLTLADAFSTLTLTAGSLNTNGQAINFNGSVNSFNISGSTARSLILGASVITIGGFSGCSWNAGTTTNLTFDAGTSNIVIALGTSGNPFSFAGGGLTYYNLTLAGVGNILLSITGINTFGSITSTSIVAHTITFGAAQTINNWNITGSSGNVVTVNSSAVGTQRTITYTGSNKIVMNYMSIRDINFSYTLGASNPYLVYAGANSTNLGNNLGIAFINGLAQRAYSLTTGTSWTVPADWNSSNNTIYMIGAGGGGATGAVSGNNRAAGGGGGGGYRLLTNQSLTPGAIVPYTIGTSAANTAGSSTTFNTTNTAGGGSAGTAATTPTSAGGAGGAGTFNGGTGGAGGFGTAVNTGYGSGGGGGAGGPNGTGGAGGTGIGTLYSGGGGGGNGGGTAGANAALAQGGTGGNNSLGTGGGAGSASAAGTAGTIGGGGGGGTNAGAGAAGGSGTDIANGAFGQGGSGGTGGSGGAAAPANTGLYGGGGGGGGVNSAGTAFAGGAGSQGVIFIVYQTPTLTIGPGFSMGPGFAIS